MIGRVADGITNASANRASATTESDVAIVGGDPAAVIHHNRAAAACGVGIEYGVERSGAGYDMDIAIHDDIGAGD